jgi:nucleotide-binding universal stress UspA family protein
MEERSQQKTARRSHMTAEQNIVVALEDGATAGVVAAGAAHFAMERGNTRVVLIHVMDDHLIMNGFAGVMGTAPASLSETTEEASSVLRLGEATLAAEYRAADRPVPPVEQVIENGRPGTVIARVARNVGATAIVIGARRPHALGRLTHPDVVSFLVLHTGVTVHVVPL